MALTGARGASPGRALTLLGAAHAVWGLVAHRDALRDIVRAGVVRSVGDGIFDHAHARGVRAAAFWFLLAAPLVAVVGYLAEAAARAGNGRAVRVAGGTVVGLGVIGPTVIPRSGFPVAVAIGGWLLHRGRALDVTGTPDRLRGGGRGHHE